MKAKVTIPRSAGLDSRAATTSTTVVTYHRRKPDAPANIVQARTAEIVLTHQPELNPQPVCKTQSLQPARDHVAMDASFRCFPIRVNRLRVVLHREIDHLTLGQRNGTGLVDIPNLNP